MNNRSHKFPRCKIMEKFVTILLKRVRKKALKILPTQNNPTQKKWQTNLPNQNPFGASIWNPPIPNRIAHSNRRERDLTTTYNYYKLTRKH